MVLLQRLSNLLRADLHAVLDRIEAPEAMLRQAIRDMGEALEQRRQDLGARERALRDVDARLETQRRRIEELNQQVDSSFDGAREDVLRELLRRRLQCEALQRALAEHRDSLLQDTETLRGKIDEQHQRLAEMRQALDRCVPQQHGEALLAQSAAIPSVAAEDVELALLRERERRARP